MAQLFANAARTTLASGISDTDTTFTLVLGDAFPVANTGAVAIGPGADWFKAVLDNGTAIEIVYVRTHTSLSETFSDVLRGQEGTTAIAWSAGAVVGLRVTAADMPKTVCLPIAVSDETTDLTTGTAKVTFRMPFAMTLTAVRASVTTAPTGSVLTVDINESGTSILSTKLTIDATEKTSTTAATPAVISDSALADDAEMTIDIDGVGSTVAGAGLKVYLIGTV